MLSFWSGFYKKAYLESSDELGALFFKPEIQSPDTSKSKEWGVKLDQSCGAQDAGHEGGGLFTPKGPDRDCYTGYGT